MKTAISVLAITGILVGAATADAKTVAYRGKATGGDHITFKKTGNRIKNIKAGVPVVCLSGTQGYQSESGVDLFAPPGSFKIGKTGTRKKLQKTAMWFSKVTKHYKVTTRKAGKKIKGKLHMSFSYAVPTPYYTLIFYYCSSDAKFTARPR